METASSSNAWDWIYATRALDAVGWFEPDPVTSRELIGAAITRGGRSIIDVGGGGSHLVDHLLDEDLDRIAVLDVSEAGLAVARHRLGSHSERVTWIVGDAAELDDVGTFDIWHDRGAFHFLLEEPARRHYAQLAERTIPVGGVAIVATFAEDGPERCSGMPVHRYEPDDLERELGPCFRLADSRRYLHHTPAGVPQMFQYSTFERIDPGADRAQQAGIDGDA